VLLHTAAMPLHRLSSLLQDSPPPYRRSKPVQQALERVHCHAEVSPVPLLHCFLGLIDLRPRG